MRMTTIMPRPLRRTAAVLDYDFMRTAFAAGGVVAILSGLVGYFLVLRGQTFAGHALSHVGFTGATGAILFGLSPLAGLVGFTVLAGMGMGLLGERIAARDVAVGMMLSVALGLGLLFLHFYTAYATQATALLFGNVLGVSQAALASVSILSAISLVALATIARPAVRQPAARVGRSQGGADAHAVGGLLGHRRRGDRRMRADRRGPAGLHADGRAGGGGAGPLVPLRDGDRARRAVRPRRGVGRHRALVGNQLADELLDHHPLRRRLSREPRRGPPAAPDGARLIGAGTCHRRAA
jgi:hypothetical protein